MRSTFIAAFILLFVGCDAYGLSEVQGGYKLFQVIIPGKVVNVTGRFYRADIYEMQDLHYWPWDPQEVQWEFLIRSFNWIKGTIHLDKSAGKWSIKNAFYDGSKATDEVDKDVEAAMRVISRDFNYLKFEKNVMALYGTDRGSKGIYILRYHIEPKQEW